MISEHLALVTDALKKKAAERFGLAPDSLKMLDGFENIVFEASRNDQPCILRLSHSTHRTPEHVHAELHWLDYLASNNVSVCTPIRSRQGSLTEHIEAVDGSFIAVVFERAPGCFVKKPDQTPQMAFNRGQLLGRMHALTKEYQPPKGMPTRYPWYDEPDFKHADRFLKPEDAVIGERFAELQAALKAIPTSHDDFGLIHMDPHTGNVFFDGDKPTIFDFDDCAYDFFVSDLAISLFYAVLNLNEKQDRTAYARSFFKNLVDGYGTEYGLDNRWCEVIPMILKRREMVLYVAIHRGFDEDDFGEWSLKYISERRPTIVNRIPYLDLDWSEFDLGG